MDKTALDAKALDGGASGTAHILRQILYNIVDGIILIVDDIHDGHVCDIARLKHGTALRIDDRVIGVDDRMDELFHNIRDTDIPIPKEVP